MDKNEMAGIIVGELDKQAAELAQLREQLKTEYERGLADGANTERSTQWINEHSTVTQLRAEVERLREALLVYDLFNHINNDTQAYCAELSAWALGRQEKPNHKDFGIRDDIANSIRAALDAGRGK